MTGAERTVLELLGKAYDAFTALPEAVLTPQACRRCAVSAAHPGVQFSPYRLTRLAV